MKTISTDRSWLHKPVSAANAPKFPLHYYSFEGNQKVIPNNIPGDIKYNDMENGPVEIVDVPICKMVMFHSFYGILPEILVTFGKLMGISGSQMEVL